MGNDSDSNEYSDSNSSTEYVDGSIQNTQSIDGQGY